MTLDAVMPHLPASTRRRWMAASLVACLPPVGLPLPAMAGNGRPGPVPAQPLLASVYTGQVEPSLCLVSEKYDGVRALWDGQRLRHRSGRPVAAPASFIAGLPAHGLDGELWLGRGRFDALSAIVRRNVPSEAEWQAVRYMVFEMPGAGGSFTERAARIAAAAAAHARATSPQPRFEAAPQSPGGDRADLQKRLATVVAGGGEGLVLHLAVATEASGRSGVLMKLKPELDAEARVIGHTAGSGRQRGRLGALEVETPEGVRFRLGSGFSDRQREMPPALGTMVTYRYRDLTPGGVPRFATFVRVHEAL